MSAQQTDEDGHKHAIWLLAIPLAILIFVTLFLQVPLNALVASVSIVFTTLTVLIDRLYPKKTLGTALPILLAAIILIYGLQFHSKPITPRWQSLQAELEKDLKGHSFGTRQDDSLRIRRWLKEYRLADTIVLISKSQNDLFDSLWEQRKKIIPIEPAKTVENSAPGGILADCIKLTESLNACLTEESPTNREAFLRDFKVMRQAEVLIERPRKRLQRIPGGLETFLTSTADLMNIHSATVTSFRHNEDGIIDQITLSIFE